MRAGVLGLHDELFDRWLTTTLVGGFTAYRDWSQVGLATTQPELHFNSSTEWHPTTVLKILMFRTIGNPSLPTFRFLKSNRLRF